MAFVVRDLSCGGIIRAEAWKRCERLLLFTIPDSIIPFVENVLLYPVDDAGTS